MFIHHGALKTRRKLNPQGNPKSISGMFGDLNDIKHAYVQLINAEQLSTIASEISTLSPICVFLYSFYKKDSVG